MPRHTDCLPRRLAPFRRAAATAGLTAAALVVGVGGYSVATSPALADTPGDRFALGDLFGGDETEAAERSSIDPATARRDDEQASRSLREPLPAAGLPSTSAEAQAWVDEVGELESAIERRTAEEEAARAAAEAEAARVAAEEESARVAAEEEAARVAAEEEAARVAAEEEAARVAAEEEAARVAAEEEAEVAAAAAAEEAEEAAHEEAAEEAEAFAAADPGSNRAIAQSLLSSSGFGSGEWSCLDDLWQKESGWDHTADNPSSSAYGIPQALPGSKMSSAGSDWESNPETQIRWGLGYIEDRYGSPCAAWEHSVNNNWY